MLDSVFSLPYQNSESWCFAWIKTNQNEQKQTENKEIAKNLKCWPQKLVKNGRKISVTKMYFRSQGEGVGCVVRFSVSFWRKFDFECEYSCMKYFHFYVKVPQTAKKSILVKWLSEERSFMRGQALYKGPKFFFIIWGFMGIKRRRIKRRFQKYKLAFVTKCVYKKFVFLV
jgi:hypothetical protein